METNIDCVSINKLLNIQKLKDIWILRIHIFQCPRINSSSNRRPHMTYVHLYMMSIFMNNLYYQYSKFILYQVWRLNFKS